MKLNNFDLDCDQKKIIEDLIKNVQPNEEAVPIYKFNFKKVDLEFWDNNLRQGWDSKVTLVGQHKLVNKYEFSCVNSWGDKKNPEPIFSSKDIHSLHYISLILESGSRKEKGSGSWSNAFRRC